MARKLKPQPKPLPRRLVKAAQRQMREEIVEEAQEEITKEILDSHPYVQKLTEEIAQLRVRLAKVDPLSQYCVGQEVWARVAIAGRASNTSLRVVSAVDVGLVMRAHDVSEIVVDVKDVMTGPWPDDQYTMLVEGENLKGCTVLLPFVVAAHNQSSNRINAYPLGGDPAKYAQYRLASVVSVKRPGDDMDEERDAWREDDEDY